MADNKRRSARVLAERKRSIYFEPTSDDDFEQSGSEGEEEYHPRQEREQQPPSPAPAAPARPKKKRKVERRPKPQTRAKEKRMERFKAKGSRSRKKHGFNLFPPTPSKNKEQSKSAFSGPSDGVIPDWTRLPPEIWRDIFIFASQPIHEQSATAIANVTWLMRAARTCRAFAVPALEAYYQSPSILPTTPPHGLLALLQMPQENLYMNYKYRVKRLEIDVRRLAQGAHGRRPFKLDALVSELPRLQHLEVIHPQHTPPYRSFKHQAWELPLNVFEEMVRANIRLKSWRWSQNMIPASVPGDHCKWMAGIHYMFFEHLERLVLCNFDYVDPKLSDALPPETVPALARAITALPALKDLTFISCEAIANDFLLHLPTNLSRLEISNCLEVTSSMLETYLAQSGAHLHTLILNHNASLNLAFLEHLRPSCPQLQTLKIDLTYYSERMNYNDAAALYDHILTPAQIPTWPSTLQHLEIVHLQKLEAEAAENLFRSLVDAAAQLTDLRHLALQAHIDIPWRDRAGFRDQWIERLKRVYLRKTPVPDPRLASMKVWRAWKEAQQKDDGGERERVRRKVSHVRVTPRKTKSSHATDADADAGAEDDEDTIVYSDSHALATTPPRRRSTRVAESRSASTAAEESSSSSDSSDEEESSSEPSLFIQGLCTVVDIRIDNQRPRENQYTEANFLDSEPSGDEDWREGVEGSEDGEEGYAW